ncbi:pyrroline-5-carboxylate reductase dimerization domain-containing protein [Paracoccus sp. J56]|uniref:pyrroline-5-carboxylate reductase dimerization domain-containing protein n=1 Tax=Paracoccus sp. J56 TaxID=935850 RepID=UPI000A0AE937|nr:pyrroline-5-carboxylate reductase dimerization domain-containing protein [Paracoccus sp. J56]SMG53783.1 pyrroline-5-carboxylate reductase [Paracoccus sp. J56]
MRTGIIGATGWLGSALGAGLLSRGISRPDELVLLNRSGPRPDYHGYENVIWVANAADLVAQSEVVVVSVRPEDWAALELKADGRLIISFMAGIDARTLSRCRGRIVRAMPNAAAEIGASYSPFWAAEGVSEADRATVRRVLSAIGTTDELETEAQIDLMTALPGSGAAYPAMMAVAMAGFMRAQGVSDVIAWRAAEAAVVGGARLLEGRMAEAPELLAAYRGYRGTTATGIEAAEAAGFAKAVTVALAAATDKARRMTIDAGDQV